MLNPTAWRLPSNGWGAVDALPKLLSTVGSSKFLSSGTTHAVTVASPAWNHCPPPLPAASLLVVVVVAEAWSDPHHLRLESIPRAAASACVRVIPPR